MGAICRDPENLGVAQYVHRLNDSENNLPLFTNQHFLNPFKEWGRRGSTTVTF